MKNKKVTLQECKDILITAVEGGINHWADVTEYDHKKGVAMIHKERRTTGMVITAHMIKEAIPAFVYYANSHMRPDFDLSDIDSELADAIIQFIRFGGVVYS